MIVVPSAGKKKKTKAKVLLVDDSLYLAAKLTPIVSERGFEVLLARDGQEGIEQLEKNPDVAVCVTDINMPRMDGMTFLRKVRNELGLKDLKVMVLSTENSRGLFDQAEDLGVIAWIVKPANLQVLSDAIASAIEED
jgi:two-component system chemotaxis response regulator CheY